MTVFERKLRKINKPAGVEVGVLIKIEGSLKFSPKTIGLVLSKVKNQFVNTCPKLLVTTTAAPIDNVYNFGLLSLFIFDFEYTRSV